MAKKTLSTSVLKKVLLRIRKYTPLLFLSLTLALVQVAANLTIPILVGQAIDNIVEAGKVNFTAMAKPLQWVLICTLVGALAQWVMTEMNNRITYRVVRDLRQEAFCHIQVLPLSYLDSHPQGDTVSRVISDVDTFADGLLLGFTQFFTGMMTILGTLVIMLTISWQIAWWCCASRLCPCW